ncbi:4Fe-4S dicluster domain-containing protein [Candidatus Omnitrophota bacterium]
MSNSAEQVHHGKLNVDSQKGDDVRLYVDLDLYYSKKCDKDQIKCSFYYHPTNDGIASVAELATYALVCRRCEEAHCVNSCPVDALQQQKDKNKLLIRHNMRCVSCKSCSHACPYGTIYPEHVPFLISNCDFCLDRRNKNEEPLCVKTCNCDAIRLEKGDIELDENTFLVGDNIVVHSTHWQWEKA